MPRYFFDIDDGEAIRRDTQGSDLPNVSAAQREATETLAQIARDVFRSKEEGALCVAIRDEAGLALRTVRLTMTVDDYH